MLDITDVFNSATVWQASVDVAPRITAAAVQTVIAHGDDPGLILSALGIEAS